MDTANDDGTWLLQAEAAQAAGVSVAAIRKWRRAGIVASRRHRTSAGVEHVSVRLEDVQARAGEAGAPAPRSGLPGEAEADAEAVEAAEPEENTAPEPAAPSEPEQAQPEPAMESASEPPETAAPATQPPTPPTVQVADPAAEALGTDLQPAPSGGMLVPQETWQRILDQLGNLHEAGRQLAEARERAAKAETEALFLRQQLARLREAETRSVAPEPEPAVEVVLEPVAAPVELPSVIELPASTEPLTGAESATASVPAPTAPVVPEALPAEAVPVEVPPGDDAPLLRWTTELPKGAWPVTEMPRAGSSRPVAPTRRRRRWWQRGGS